MARKIKPPFMNATRLQHALDSAGITKAELARRMDLTPQAVQGWFKKGTINADNLKQLAAITRRSMEWLLDESPLAAEPPADYRVDDDKYALIPRYDVQAGAGQARDNGHEEVSGRHAYRRDWLERKGLTPATCAVIEARGDSMLPTISDGDVVLINLQAKRVINGGVYAFRADEGPRLKRLFKQLDGRVRVASDNADKINFPDEFLTPGMEAEIIGQVVHRSGGV